ncbi:amino acid ABC transporter permease [Erwinia typographi]|uniref:ABC-type xenobiotic transporter n=1 Tax=Erwinia typographi TaxID=371042 RepID=A0A0A4A8V9_9GAMM|nr:cysteine/glutathione ABC transporter permease/ATP-binding protein CydD [Erwinia typographi]KGT94268.1 amino acid ABC transporter permease [Erwinia typographi]
MNKTRQQQLLRWLKNQTGHGKRWLRLSLLLGVLSALLIVCQAWLLASLLQALIVEHLPREALVTQFILLLVCFTLRGVLAWLREKVGFECGKAIRTTLRRSVLNQLSSLGPAWIQGKPAGSWATLLLEQIEEMQDYYSRYLPQMLLAVFVPCFILLALFPVNWAAALILLCTAPLIPLFMALVGMGAADANRRNFKALARLSGHFLDRLRGLETLRLFHRAEAETASIREASEDFRQRTMEVLRLAFLSSAVLEFFASLSIAVVAVYFGFSYLGELNFGHYGPGVTLFAGFLALILAPEFFQPLRDLGTFYHAKAQAVGGADALETFLTHSETLTSSQGDRQIATQDGFTFQASELEILSPDGKVLAGPLSFMLLPGMRVVLVGQSGAGKTSLLNVLLGFLPYQGSLRVNGVELRDIAPEFWQQQLAWVGQNPHLPAATLRQNITLGALPDSAKLDSVCELAGVTEFLDQLAEGLDSEIGEQAAALSVGQAQRVAVARALYKPCHFLLLDEPGASLDSHSEQRVNEALLNASFNQTTLMITHQLDRLDRWDEVWLMRNGKIVQQGNPAQLLHTPGAFAELAAQRQETVE